MGISIIGTNKPESPGTKSVKAQVSGQRETCREPWISVQRVDVDVVFPGAGRLATVAGTNQAAGCLRSALNTLPSSRSTEEEKRKTRGAKKIAPQITRF